MPTTNGTKEAARETNVVSWEVDGTRYDVDLYDIDGVEWRDINRVTGLIQTAAMHQALLVKEFNCIAAFLWIWRRRTDPDLTYEDVLKSLSYRSFTQKEDEASSPPG